MSSEGYAYGTHYRSIGECNAVFVHYTAARMDMSEEMQAKLEIFKAAVPAMSIREMEYFHDKLLK